jgi:hypothetical protein
LEALFSSDELRPFLTFKGGTSLSKVWKLVDRFSEDIDIVVDRSHLGFSGLNDPETAPNPSARKRLVERLKSACSEYLQSTLVPIVSAFLNRQTGMSGIELDMDPGDPDGQTILVRYPSSLENNAAAYINPGIKIELGARSGNEPVLEGTVTSLAAEAFSGIQWVRSVAVRALDPARTFLEKMFLIHEENMRPEGKPGRSRLSRHLYDLVRLNHAGIGQRALLSPDLMERVLANRKALFFYSWVDYEVMKPGTICLVPPSDKARKLRQDYQEFSRDMIYGIPPAFDQLLESLKLVELLVNQPKNRSK